MITQLSTEIFCALSSPIPNYFASRSNEKYRRRKRVEGFDGTRTARTLPELSSNAADRCPRNDLCFTIPKVVRIVPSTAVRSVCSKIVEQNRMSRKDYRPLMLRKG